MQTLRYISVILPLKLEWSPVYSVADCENVHIDQGDWVKVRFAGKEYHGIVDETDINPDIDSSRIQAVISLERDMPKVGHEEIELWKTVARYYICSVGEVFKAAYPHGKVTMEESHGAALKKTAARREKIAESIRSRISRLKERLATKEERLSHARQGTKSYLALSSSITKIREELARTEGTLKAVSACDIKGSCKGGAVNPDLSPRSNAGLMSTIILSPAQECVYKKINEAFMNNKPVLLHGITGSGKTEIYIKLAQETLAKGRNVLYLVPEIALSRQLEERLKGHFGERLYIFHSAETAARRRNIAEAMRRTRTAGSYVVMGTRSSLFLPHNNLGLIIVDEEHDSSYKQDSPAPRYNGRDTALMMHRLYEKSECRIILGSATPSLEEIYNCRTGKHIRIELNERYHGAPQAEVEIIDTNQERRKRGMHGSFSRKLIECIRETLEKGEQVMLLRARRSWAPMLQCESCGETVKCPHCNVSMSLHNESSLNKNSSEYPGRNQRMVCHSCGYTCCYDGKCRKCSGNIICIGAGTQRIEEEAAALFPDAGIARMDSDTNKNNSFITRSIKDFSEGRLNIMIGTQIVGKGFDFSNVSLVAVIAADSLLGIQDFRADEKAFQIFEQLRGRSGRRSSRGKLMIQTAQPDHPVFRKLINSENEDMYESLLMERRDFSYPPFCRTIELTIKDRNQARAIKMAMLLSDELRNGLSGCQTSVPVTPAVDRIADRHIRKIRVNIPKDRSLSGNRTRLKEMVHSFEKSHRYESHISIDVDPV